jgi:hypothetical protein
MWSRQTTGTGDGFVVKFRLRRNDHVALEEDPCWYQKNNNKKPENKKKKNTREGEVKTKGGKKELKSITDHQSCVNKSDAWDQSLSLSLSLSVYLCLSLSNRRVIIQPRWHAWKDKLEAAIDVGDDDSACFLATFLENQLAMCALKCDLTRRERERERECNDEGDRIIALDKGRERESESRQFMAYLQVTSI